MKIDEPPTPYNKDYDSGTEEDDEESTSSEREGHKAGGQADERAGIVKDVSHRAHFIDEVSTALEASKQKPARRPRFSSDEDTTEDDDALNGSDLEGREMGGTTSLTLPISKMVPTPSSRGSARSTTTSGRSCRSSGGGTVASFRLDEGTALRLADICLLPSCHQNSHSNDASEDEEEEEEDDKDRDDDDTIKT